MDQELIRAARRADLAEFLLLHHPDEVKKTGKCVYLRDHESVYTRLGYCGYTRFSSDETGNSIDFLRRYLGYSFQDAVRALTSGSDPVPEVQPVEDEYIKLPEMAEQPFKRVYAYLTQKRGIPARLIQYLIEEGLLYQEAMTGNAVFISRNKDFCELRGTSTHSSRPFHGIRRRRPECFWSLKTTLGQAVSVAYVCESSIDAISLFLLHAAAGVRESSAYVGIGGVRNQQTIDRIRDSVRTVIAVDNDDAGLECRKRNANLEHIVPTLKDWNEDLLHGIKPAQLYSNQNNPCISKI